MQDSAEKPQDESAASFPWWNWKGKPRQGPLISRWALMLFGVVLPLITLAVELVLHLCAEVYVDPIPDFWHGLLIATVAGGNFAAWKVFGQKQIVHYKRLGFISGLTIGISLFYALIFAPLAPFAAVALLFYGLGFLPLSPMLACACALWSAWFLRKIRMPDGKIVSATSFIFLGIVVAGAAIVALELPPLVTHLGLQQASMTNLPQQSRAGVRLIRRFGSEQALLRDCYNHSASVSDIPGFFMHAYEYISRDQARNLYYRVYGKPFNSVAKPDKHRLSFEDFDSEVAGESVGGRVRGLSLSSSAIAGKVYPQEALAYMEWTMDFKNDSAAQQEARTQIAMPPGAVVSRVTLWVNGVPQDAVFGERGVVRRAYQAVVSRKRDPLLVTSAGADRVLVQCFPVPPRMGATPGAMKIRIGMTVPMALADAEHATMFFPRLLENNFDVKTTHQLSIQSEYGQSKISTASPLALSKAGTTVAGSVSDDQLATPGLFVASARPDKLTSFWSPAPMSGGKKFIVERAVPISEKPPKSVVIVVDGAGSMQPFVPQIAAALKNIPPSVKTQVLFASDEISSLGSGTEQLQQAAAALGSAPYIGGPDNMPALLDAIKLAANTDGVVLWIHGPQPALFTDTTYTQSALEQLAPAMKPHLYEIEVKSGPNRVAEALSQNVIMTTIPRQFSLEKDLGSLFEGWSGNRVTYKLERAVVDKMPGGTGTQSPERASQLAALWAYQETQKMVSLGQVDNAVKLASHHRLVTPITGAVVLETKAQYLANGLNPDNPDNNQTSTKPTFNGLNIGAAPEPEEWCLIIVAAFILMWQTWRNRQLARNHA